MRKPRLLPSKRLQKFHTPNTVKFLPFGRTSLPNPPKDLYKYSAGVSDQLSQISLTPSIEFCLLKETKLYKNQIVIFVSLQGRRLYVKDLYLKKKTELVWLLALMSFWDELSLQFHGVKIPLFCDNCTHMSVMPLQIKIIWLEAFPKCICHLFLFVHRYFTFFPISSFRHVKNSITC